MKMESKEELQSVVHIDFDIPLDKKSCKTYKNI